MGRDSVPGGPTQGAVQLYRVTAPGSVERIGTPFPFLQVSVSGDLKRAAAVTRNNDADAWMYNVVKR